ncbi:MAG TPA: glutamine synthetase III [Eubacteriales bacterium]|jgi:glutamine synthetase|nr:glutamine synthetase III [Clostridia bacterium]HRR89188.1 glutamine synthetase III [Eubacteriales bacterium]HRU83774.1 glutamine synthetase III [Eubacteriales bacterium]
MKSNTKITDIFATEVFSDAAMKEYMSDADYRAFIAARDSDGALDRELADKAADAMKEWAMKKGVTHYTHWFQPLTGTTAEKHDSFISIDAAGQTILEFTGKNLTKGEADASSLPSGGIRATFEARGYTIWDISSPAFIKRSPDGTGILCIPTAFCAYNGEALDKKTPLLRSIEFLNREGVRLLKLLGVNTAKVYPNVGAEQEYFLVDREMYKKRIDLKFTGRTLFGAPPPKGQEKNDQYYANIKDRVLAFMSGLNEELWKLGITAKTQHNEAAPAQHELASIFTVSNIATDQNQLIMEMLKKVADRYNLTCLLHEKPFNGVNGSGKHNNWSISTAEGVNLLNPGSTPMDNKIFLIFFLAVIAGVDEYAELVRMSAACPGNEWRLGGDEAPPAIISVFVGEELEEMFNKLENGHAGIKRIESYLKMGAHALPSFQQDMTDRNRTSPFAFTGNKFEFRMVGASDSIATPNIVINTITAEMLKRICDEIEDAQKKSPSLELDRLLSEIILKYMRKHRRVIFNGNNYCEAWREEAKRRGLPEITNTPDALDVLAYEKITRLYEENNILTKKELNSRREIYLENYSKTVNIEANTMLLMASTQILPAVMQYQGSLAESFNSLSKCGNFGAVQFEKMEELEKLITKFNAGIKALEHALKRASSSSGDARAKALIYRDDVIPAMKRLRATGDKLETLCPRHLLPYPDYADLLFYE